MSDHLGKLIEAFGAVRGRTIVAGQSSLLDPGGWWRTTPHARYPRDEGAIARNTSGSALRGGGPQLGGGRARVWLGTHQAVLLVGHVRQTECRDMSM